MRATLPLATNARPLLRRRMRSGRGVGYPRWMAAVLLALICLLAATPWLGKAAQAAQVHGSVLALPIQPPAADAPAIADATPLAASGVPLDEPGPQLPVAAETSLETESSEDRCHMTRGAGFPALECRRHASVIPDGARHGHPGRTGMLPPAHAPPPIG